MVNWCSGKVMFHLKTNIDYSIKWDTTHLKYDTSTQNQRSSVAGAWNLNWDEWESGFCLWHLLSVTPCLSLRISLHCLVPPAWAPCSQEQQLPAIVFFGAEPLRRQPWLWRSLLLAVMPLGTCLCKCIDSGWALSIISEHVSNMVFLLQLPTAHPD